MAANAKIMARLDAVIARLETVTVKFGGQPGSVSKGGRSHADLKKLVERLEAAATKLESRSKANSSDSDGGIIVQGFDKVLHGKLAQFFKLSNEIGGDVKTQVDLVKQAFHSQREFLVAVSGRPRPSQDELARMLKPTSDKIDAAQEFRNKNRGSKFFNHLSSVSEGIGALLWVVAAGKPSTFIKDKSDAAMFYTNRVLKDFKNKEPKHVEWARAFVGGLKELEEYTRNNHSIALTCGK